VEDVGGEEVVAREVAEAAVVAAEEAVEAAAAMVEAAEVVDVTVAGVAREAAIETAGVEITVTDVVVHKAGDKASRVGWTTAQRFDTHHDRCQSTF